MKKLSAFCYAFSLYIFSLFLPLAAMQQEFKNIDILGFKLSLPTSVKLFSGYSLDLNAWDMDALEFLYVLSIPRERIPCSTRLTLGFVRIKLEITVPNSVTTHFFWLTKFDHDVEAVTQLCDGGQWAVCSRKEIQSTQDFEDITQSLKAIASDIMDNTVGSLEKLKNKKDLICSICEKALYPLSDDRISFTARCYPCCMHAVHQECFEKFIRCYWGGYHCAHCGCRSDRNDIFYIGAYGIISRQPV
jgi:hypothetical protein